LTGKINQNEQKYTKQTQFSKKSNVYNASYNNELQRKNEIGHSVKTNPIKPNFTRHSVWRAVRQALPISFCLLLFSFSA
jgi:hypothetical protein